MLRGCTKAYGGLVCHEGYNFVGLSLKAGVRHIETQHLLTLHQMLQVVMGWQNSHLHQFIVGKTDYGEPDPEYGDTMKDERRVRLRAIARKEGDSFLYEYDFGDGWRHVITVENIQPMTDYMVVPWCLDGARACPPEDFRYRAGSSQPARARILPRME